MAAEEMSVSQVARLARLHLSDEETTRLQKQLDDVLHYVDKLKEVDVSGVEATAHAVPMFNVARHDKIKASFSLEDALGNAPQKTQGRRGPDHLFIVPKVIE